MIQSPEIRLDEYSITDRGFLPTGLPLQKISSVYYGPWETLLVDLPGLIKTGRIRGLVDNLPVLMTEYLHDEPEWRRAYSVLGLLTHAYIWGGEKPRDVSIHSYRPHPSGKVPMNVNMVRPMGVSVDTETLMRSQILPPCISKPFLEISAHLGLPPCATYAALTLWNFTALPGADITNPDNLRTLGSLTGTGDEEWFMVISVAIEAKGARLIPLMLDAIAAATANDTPRLVALLCRFTDGLQDIIATLKRMYEKCAPEVFFHQIRPFLAGSKNMVAAGLPCGVFYDIGNGRGEWHQYSGGSNAQSSLIQTFDIFLGVSHSATGGMQTGFIQEMRRYMPAPHRCFLEKLSNLANVRSFVLASGLTSPLREAYNAAIMTLSSFRDAHIQIASRYIIMPACSSARAQAHSDKINLATASYQSGASRANFSGLAGTGGTSLIPFLKQTRDTTKDATC
ncbi:Indoleamine 2-3-dioxygenase [Penicillium capsulatum]|uniref:Indoleamine 2,3-dioxygenase n=1 Tax=Penicillium capsulatum TaxID=69766 RepID=A0A9W9LQP6_9EURO|nr:Indoleamine 2-3-dioxygenase [Penicillium capsulatum]KAJ6136480.1 Indoleamine 2-3-dioxygenase [Penicillium capsulatum]